MKKYVLFLSVISLNSCNASEGSSSSQAVQNYNSVSAIIRNQPLQKESFKFSSESARISNPIVRTAPQPATMSVSSRRSACCTGNSCLECRKCLACCGGCVLSPLLLCCCFKSIGGIPYALCYFGACGEWE